MSNNPENCKVKRNILSIEQRCNIVQRLNAGETAKSLADEFKVTKQAISWMKKNHCQIEKAREVLQNCDGNLSKKRYKKQEENLLDQKLMKWFIQRRSMGRPVSSKILQNQALLYNKRLNGKKKFAASDGWLDKFKKRYGFKNRNIHGEKLPVDLEGSENFKGKLNNLREVIGISLDCIYNCDETGLYWKIMPNETLFRKNETRGEGFKKPKNRVTVMACTNASGTHKISLLVIGKSAQPRCFRGVKNLCVHYTHQENSWMTCEIMRSWYSDVFLPEIKERHDLNNNPDTKILLIMDNAACHPPAEELNKLCEFCTVMFLPPNAISLIQPLNQGIIEKFKRRYRNDLMEKILLEEEHKNIGDNDFLESFNLLDACNLCALAWDEVTNVDIRNCWKKLIPLSSNETVGVPLTNSIGNEAFYAIMKRIQDFKFCSAEEVDSWLRSDEDDNGWQPLSDDDILADRHQAQPEMVEELDDEISYNDQNWSPHDSVMNVDCPTSIEALSGLNTFLKWYQRKGDNKDGVLMKFQEAAQELVRCVVDNSVTSPTWNMKSEIITA